MIHFNIFVIGWMYIELCVFGFMVQFWHCIVVEKKEICGLLHTYKNKFCFIFCYIIYLITEYQRCYNY